MRTRILSPGDEAALERFLAPRTESSMFLLSNARAAGLVDRGAPNQGTYAGAFVGEELVGVAAHFWNGVVGVQAPRGVGPVVLAAAGASPRAVTGIAGPAEQVRAARAALGMDGVAATLEEDEGLFTLDLEHLRVPEALARGERLCRRPAAPELPLLAEWRRAYHLEVLGTADAPDLLERCREEVNALERDGAVFVLETDGAVVATTAFNARLPEIVQVGGVYTPPALRSRGYARAAVAGSLLSASGEGVARAVLFTSSEPGRRAYDALGFRRTGSFGLVLFGH